MFSLFEQQVVYIFFISFSTSKKTNTNYVFPDIVFGSTFWLLIKLNIIIVTQQLLFWYKFGKSIDDFVIVLWLWRTQHVPQATKVCYFYLFHYYYCASFHESSTDTKNITEKLLERKWSEYIFWKNAPKTTTFV